jgi:phytoene dehydrogenase-like protein
MTMSASEFLDQWFETDPLKATMSRPGSSARTRASRARDRVRAPPSLHGRDRRRVPCLGIPKGGTGGVSNAIGSAARASAPRSGTNAPVANVIVKGRSRGRCRARIGRGDPRRLDPVVARLAPDVPEPARAGLARSVVRGRGRRFKFRGSSGKVNLAVDRLPDFTSLPGVGEHLRGAISFSPSIEDMETAYDDAKYGASAGSRTST